MFRQEADWIHHALAKVHLHGTGNVANLGSSTFLFRTKVQPHIQQQIIEPLEAKGWKIWHIDMKADEGVDIVADVSNVSVGEAFKEQFELTICTNMLEHVQDIDVVAKNLFAITADHGYILITVPYRYKIHHDPIDNGFRPTPEEILQRFPSERITCVEKAIIDITEKKYYSIKKSRFPLWGYRERIAFWFGKRHKVSAVLLSIKK